MVTLGGEAPRSAVALGRLLRRHAPGDVLPIRFLRRGTLAEGEVRLGSDPALELVAVEHTGGVLDAERRAFRDAWLGSRAAGPDPASARAVTR